MKKEISPAAMIAILVVVVAIIAVFAWRVVGPHKLDAGPSMMQWDPNKVPSTVREHLKEMQAKGGKMPPAP